MDLDDAPGPIASTSTTSSLASPSSSSSPGKQKRTVYYADRFIPNRDGIDIHTHYQLLNQGPSTPSSSKSSSRRRSHHAHSELDAQKEEANRTFTSVLKTELFGPDTVDPPPARSPASSRRSSRAGANNNGAGGGGSSAATRSPASSSSSRSLFSFSSPSRRRTDRLEATRSHRGLDSPTHERYSVSPVKFESQQLLLSPRKTPRTLSRVPFKVLDAPDLQDDYYLNLVDWSSTNTLAVGLASCVYLWNAHSSKVTKLTDLGDAGDLVTSISWVNKGNTLAVGTRKGHVLVYDTDKVQLLRKMTGHHARAGTLAWREHVLSSGSHDRTILHRDVRAPSHFVAKLTSHRQEVCGLKWNVAENQLASGGNDNKLFVWDGLHEQPLYKFSEHVAAVKAISWNPHQHGILASGGGTADMKIRFWNTLTGSLLSEIDTGSQICNLLWSKNSNEIVSTHGFSAAQLQNQVMIWKYPSLQQVCALTGHTYRVLYLAMSPDGQTIVTGAGDETLRFWHAFPSAKSARSGSAAGTGGGGVLNPFAKIR